MRPIDAPSHTNIGSSVHEKRFGIHAASHAHIVGVLTKLYSDRLLALLRELSTNAADSHISAKTNAPIRVTLPTQAKPFFAVEDFGVGMSVDDLEQTFSEYGASTKRDDDEVNGTLGLGAKAPLAYADSFTIQSRKGGVQILAVVTKDIDGVPVLKVLDTSATSEPNGVRIEVPIEVGDHQRLASKAEHFFSFWAKGSVLVNGEQPASIRDDESLIWLDDDVAVSTKHTDSYIVQHNVAYPIGRFKLGTEFSVIAYVPSGTVNFPPSREALEYTPRTEAVLETLSEYAQEAFERVIRERLEAATTVYERLVLVQEWRKYVPKVANDFFGKFGVRIQLGGHGHGWHFWPNTYGKSASRVDYIGPHDLIGEYPVVTGYDLKTLTQKARKKAVRYFANRDQQPGKFLFLPSGTPLTVLIGRANVVSWATIDAEVPDEVIPKAERTKTKTQYGIWFQGRQRASITLDQVDEVTERLDTAVNVWVIETKDRYGYRTNHAERVSERLPDALVFAIQANQVAKLEREIDAVSGWTLAQQRLEKAREALTPEDHFRAHVRPSHLRTAPLKGVLDRVLDPELRAVIEQVHAPYSPRLKAFEALGGDVYSLPDADDSSVEAMNERYSLLTRHTSLVTTEQVEEALLYVNAKYQSINPAKDVR